jgi:electron transfer flavoprotein alpha subunit
MGKSLFLSLDGTDLAVGAAVAAKFAETFDVLVLTSTVTASFGAEKVSATGWASLPPAAAYAAEIATLATGYSRVFAVSAMWSKDLLPRAAGVADAACVTDVLSIESDSRFTRPMYAGAIVATVEVSAPQTWFTFRPVGFPAVSDEGASVSPEAVSIVLDSAKVQNVGSRAKEGGRPDLSAAKVVVSGGRPLKDAATFERVVGGLADALGGAVGATRAAVDAGIAANELQVGQTGKIVAPDLYIAAGISGSTQHMAGIKDSKLIVAINTDGDAPIFSIADLGLVGDLYEVLPVLERELKKA